MGDRPDQPNSPLQPWLWWLSAMESLAGRSAPEQLTQSILPWTFAGVVINQQNSSAPATEHAIVAEQSYGRQLGRISEALEELIRERPAGAPVSPALQAFETMQKGIATIKARTARGRVEQLLADLKELKRDSPADYRRVTAALRDLT